MPTALFRARAIDNGDLTDPEIVRRVLDGETALFELLIRRSNAYLYKVARAHDFAKLGRRTGSDASHTRSCVSAGISRGWPF
jgi:RNA polymerase sigma-70 factor (ECF subfamily)